MKRILFSFFVLLLFVQHGVAQRAIIDKVVAQVGGELVLLSEIEEQRALMESQQGSLPENARCYILDQIMIQKLMINQAKLDSIEVSDEEIEGQLDARLERILALMGNDVQQFEDYYGQSVGQVKKQFREDLKGQMLSERMRGQVMADVTVTPSEVRDFFNQIPKDSLPYFNSEVEIGEIVVLPRVSEVEKNKARQKLESLRKRIVEDGEDFSEIAGKFSNDFASARIGGDLGWTSRGKFVPEFEAAAYSLEPGEISEVFESEFGFHIVYLNERRGNTINTKHILIKPEIVEDDLVSTQNYLDSVRSLIVNDSMSFSVAVKKFGDESVQSFNNDGRMVNPQSGNTFFSIGDLDPDVYFTIDSMEVGQISGVLPYLQANGDKAFRIMYLQSRTKPHTASLKEDYSRIQLAAIESKKSTFINKWLEDKVQGTFVQIDPRYAGCPMLDKWDKDKTP